MRTADVVIVGAGHAGAATAVALRQGKFRGSIVMVGEEAEIPYERPSLSKEYLAGEREFERLTLRPAQYWKDAGVDLWLGSRVTSVDASRQCLTLADQATLGYQKLIWAAGGHPRRISCPGSDLKGVHVVRSRLDVDKMRADLGTANRVAVIGAGYIGLEAAAVLRKLGKTVFLLEAMDRVLARVAGVDLSRFLLAEHRAQGVNVRTEASVEALIGTDDRVSAVRLATGEVIYVDMVIVGIGIIPAVGPLREAGAAGNNGVWVDSQCRTSLPHVYAVGDCALHENRYAAGGAVRLESVQNAADQGVVAARSVLGAEIQYDSVPWFWSNQYDIKLQTVGLCLGHDQAVLRGDPSSRRFSVIYLRGGRVVALDCVNASRDYLQGRRLVADRVAADPNRITDTTQGLKELFCS